MTLEFRDKDGYHIQTMDGRLADEVITFFEEQPNLVKDKAQFKISGMPMDLPILRATDKVLCELVGHYSFMLPKYGYIRIIGAPAEKTASYFTPNPNTTTNENQSQRQEVQTPPIGS